jgi:glyoxylase-like metal-dependent hydrolase (beta-lactamase superfamily II)
MKFGDFEISSFVEHKFRLDGGSMFGVIPKVIWQKLIPADENNMIPMHTNLFVLKAHNKNFIFDCGLGDDLSDFEKKIYNVESESMLIEGLQSLGLSEDDIDVVILSHLHTDHAGGAVKKIDGEFVPRFKNAKYIIGKEEWHDATHPDERTSAVYVVERYEALENSKQIEFVDSNVELYPGISIDHTSGHTGGHFAVRMESGGEKVWYYADIFCTSVHMAVAYVPGTDLYPIQTMEAKRKLLPQIIEEKIIMAFDHDVKMPFATVAQEGKKIIVTPVELIGKL